MAGSLRMKSWTEIEGWLDKDEGELLQELIKAMPSGTVWCEIGSWKGRSAACMAETGVRGYAIDPFTGSPEHEEGTNTYQEFLENTAELDVHVFKRHSQSIHKLVPYNIGLLFIDGEHSYEAVSRDYNLYQDHVVPGGFIVLHDAAPHEGTEHAWPEVEKFAEELENSGLKLVRVRNRIVAFQK